MKDPHNPFPENHRRMRPSRNLLVALALRRPPFTCLRSMMSSGQGTGRYEGLRILGCAKKWRVGKSEMLICGSL